MMLESVDSMIDLEMLDIDLDELLLELLLALELFGFEDAKEESA